MQNVQIFKAKIREAVHGLNNEVNISRNVFTSFGKRILKCLELAGNLVSWNEVFDGCRFKCRLKILLILNLICELNKKFNYIFFMSAESAVLKTLKDEILIR